MFTNNFRQYPSRQFAIEFLLILVGKLWGKNPVNCSSGYQWAAMRLLGSSLISCHASISPFDDEKCSAALFLRWISMKKRVQWARLPDTLRQHQDANIISRWNIDNGTISLSFKNHFSMSRKSQVQTWDTQARSKILQHPLPLEVAGLLVCSHTQKTPINCRWGECNHDQSWRPDNWTWAAQNFVLCHKKSRCVCVFVLYAPLRSWCYNCSTLYAMLYLMFYRKMGGGRRNLVGMYSHGPVFHKLSDAVKWWSIRKRVKFFKIFRSYIKKPDSAFLIYGE